MVCKGVVVRPQSSIRLVRSGLQRLHTLEQVVELVEGVLVQSWPAAALHNFRFRLVGELGQLLLKGLDSFDGVVGGILACENVHQLVNVESVSCADLGHDNLWFVLELLNLLCVTIDDLLVCGQGEKLQVMIRMAH